jgi:hypothetical protein
MLPGKSKDSEVLLFGLGRRQNVPLFLAIQMGKFVILFHADSSSAGKSQIGDCFHPLPSSLGRFYDIVKIFSVK